MNDQDKKPAKQNQLNKSHKDECKTNVRKHAKSMCKQHILRKKPLEKYKNSPCVYNLLNLKQLNSPKAAKENFILQDYNKQVIQNNIIRREKLYNKKISNKKIPLIRNGNLNKTEEALNFLQIIDRENI